MTNPVLFLSLIPVLVFMLLAKPRQTLVLLLGVLTIFYVPFTQGELLTVGGAKIYLGDLVAASLSIFLGIRVLQKRSVRSSINKSFFFSVLFLVWGGIAIMRGLPVYGYSAVGESRAYVLPLLYYFSIIASFKDKVQIHRLVKWFLLCVGLMLLVHFVSFYFLGGIAQIPSELLGDYRSIFRFINATESLAIAFVLISLLLFYLGGEIQRSRSLVYVSLGILAVVLVAVQERSVWLAVGVGLVAVYLRLKRRIVRLVIPLVVGVPLLVLLPFFGNFLGQDIFTSLTKSSNFLVNPMADITAPWRLAGWSQELQKAMENPFLGQGLGGYSEWFDGSQWQRVAVHNGYIMGFSKFGIIGLIVFSATIFYWFVAMIRYGRAQPDRQTRLLAYALSVCVAMHLIYMFFYDFTIFFWVLLAMGTVLTARSRREPFVSLSVPVS